MTENEAINEIIKEVCSGCYGSDEEPHRCSTCGFKMAKDALAEIQKYRAIGKVEELKALKEKNTPYKPNEYEDRYYACKCDNILLPKWKKYPTILMPKSEGLPHCMACGQKLDWSE